MNESQYSENKSQNGEKLKIQTNNSFINRQSEIDNKQEYNENNSFFDIKNSDSDSDKENENFYSFNSTLNQEQEQKQKQEEYKTKIDLMKTKYKLEQAKTSRFTKMVNGMKGFVDKTMSKASQAKFVKKTIDKANQAKEWIVGGDDKLKAQLKEYNALPEVYLKNKELSKEQEQLKKLGFVTKVKQEIKGLIPGTIENKIKNTLKNTSYTFKVYTEEDIATMLKKAAEKKAEDITTKYDDKIKNSSKVMAWFYKKSTERKIKKHDIQVAKKKINQKISYKITGRNYDNTKENDALGEHMNQFVKDHPEIKKHDDLGVQAMRDEMKKFYEQYDNEKAKKQADIITATVKVAIAQLQQDNVDIAQLRQDNIVIVPQYKAEIQSQQQQDNSKTKSKNKVCYYL